MKFTILIAENELRLREILCDFFSSRGATPISAPDGLAALELAQTQICDICLLDIMMPGLDGLSAGHLSPSFFLRPCLMKRISCWAMSWEQTIM